jgi:hypothetical protein
MSTADQLLMLQYSSLSIGISSVSLQIIAMPCSYRRLRPHLGQARIRSILNQSQSILMLQQLTVSKDKRIALWVRFGRMGVQKLSGHGDEDNLEREANVIFKKQWPGPPLE